MNESKALALVESEFGSLEEFAYAVLTHDQRHKILDETESVLARADLLGLPVLAFSRILSSPAFKSTLRTAIVNRNFGYFDEEKHIREVVKVAVGEERKVMSPKGTIGLVDQAPGDMIAAGKYLNDLRGTSVEPKGGGSIGGISIQILNANSEATTELTVEAGAPAHTPRGAGALPPRGVLERGSRAVPSAALTERAESVTPAGGAATSAGPASEAPRVAPGREAPGSGSHSEADVIAAETRRRALSRSEGEVDSRRKLWQELPERAPAVTAPDKPSRYGD